MKIGIITLPLHTNYGGILQAYALQTVLERMGHEVCLIEKKHKLLPFPLWKAPFVYGKRILNLSGDALPVFYEQSVRKYTNRFINQYIKRRIVANFSGIKGRDFDTFVVGSDQVWRPKYFLDGIEHAYLDFTKGWNVKRIAYAASFGTDEWEYTHEQTECCGKLLKHFDAISVREDSGVALCREHFDVEAQHVLDPTMLLAKEDYIRLFENARTPNSKGTLLTYILDETPEKLAWIDRIAKEKKIVPFRVKSKVVKRGAGRQGYIQPSVEQWLRGFYDAEFVVTDSFHACVFSILFNKPFIAIGNAQRGMSRFISLLEIFGLENRIASDLFNDKIINSEIDWNRVNSTLTSRMVSSKTFLKDNLIG